MADRKRPLDMSQGFEEAKASLDAYLRMTQQAAGEQKPLDPSVYDDQYRPYVPPGPDDGQGPVRFQMHDIPSPGRPRPEAANLEAAGPPPMLRPSTFDDMDQGRGAQSAQAPPPLPPFALPETPDIGTPESISLKARPSILDGMEHTSDIRPVPGRDSGEVRLEGYENARGGNRGRSKWKDPATYLGIADKLAAGWAAPGRGGGFAEGWAMAAGDERAQQQGAARAPYENRQLAAETRKAEAEAQLAKYEAEAYQGQSEFERTVDEAKLTQTETHTKYMNANIDNWAETRQMKRDQIPYDQLLSLTRASAQMALTDLYKKRLTMSGQMSPEDLRKLDAEIAATEALTDQRLASGKLSRRRAEWGPRPSGQSGQQAGAHPLRVRAAYQKTLTEIHGRNSDPGGRIRDPVAYKEEVDEATAYYMSLGMAAPPGRESPQDKIFRAVSDESDESGRSGYTHRSP